MPRCPFTFIYRPSKKGLRRRLDYFYTTHPAFRDNDKPKWIKDTDELRPCPGHVKVSVQAVDEPYYGGATARLVVLYVCDVCGKESNGQFIPNAPTADNLDEWINARLEELGEGGD